MPSLIDTNTASISKSRRKAGSIHPVIWVLSCVSSLAIGAAIAFSLLIGPHAAWDAIVGASHEDASQDNSELAQLLETSADPDVTVTPIAGLTVRSRSGSSSQSAMSSEPVPSPNGSLSTANPAAKKRLGSRVKPQKNVGQQQGNGQPAARASQPPPASSTASTKSSNSTGAAQPNESAPRTREGEDEWGDPYK